MLLKLIIIIIIIIIIVIIIIAPAGFLAQRPKPEEAELKSPHNHGKLLYTRWNLDLNKGEARKVLSGNRNIYTS